MHAAQDRHFGRLCRHRRLAHFGMALQQQLPQPVQGGKRQLGRPARDRGPVRVRQRRVRCARKPRPGDAMHHVQQPADQRLRIDPGPMRPVDCRHRRRCIRRKNRAQQRSGAPAIGQAQHVAHGVRRHRACACKRDCLVQHRQPVANAAFGCPRDQRKRLGVRRHPLGLGDMAEMRRQQVHRDPLQVEALAAAQDRRQQLLNLGRRKHELHMRRRLFQGFQQRIPGVLAQHVRFVDDIDLVARLRRRIAHRLDDLARIVDTGVRRSVHLDHIDMLPLRDRHAVAAHPAGRHRRPAQAVGPDAVQRLGDDPRSRGLADPAHPRQQPGLRQPVAGNRIRQRGNNRLLPDQRIESRRPVFPGQHAIGRIFGEQAHAPVSGLSGGGYQGAGAAPARPGCARRAQSPYRRREPAWTCRSPTRSGPEGSSRNDFRCGSRRLPLPWKGRRTCAGARSRLRALGPGFRGLTRDALRTGRGACGGFRRRFSSALLTSARGRAVPGRAPAGEAWPGSLPRPSARPAAFRR